MKIQITSKTVSSAIDEALIKLDTTIDQIEHKVIQEPSKGFLGIGTKPAIIEVWKTGEENGSETEKKEKFDRTEKREAPKTPRYEHRSFERTQRHNTDYERNEVFASEKPKREYKERTTDPCEVSKKFLDDIFKAMGISVDVQAELIDSKYLNINLKGENMGVIIGKRGQTLDSLQYLVNLTVNRGEAPYISVNLDTEEYRKRRRETLENLAYNLAKKAKHIRKNVVLEPMNPYERRIIHSALQNDRYVTTYSEGEEPFRYVVISPKKYY